MKKINNIGFISIPLLIGIIVVISSVTVVGYFGIKQYQATQTNKERLTNEAQKQKDLEIEALEAQVDSLVNKPVPTSTEIIVQEVSDQATKDKINNLQKQVDCQALIKKTPSWGDARYVNNDIVKFYASVKEQLNDPSILADDALTGMSKKLQQAVTEAEPLYLNYIKQCGNN